MLKPKPLDPGLRISGVTSGGCAGFTLIELTVVAAIFALFVAMAASRFRQSFDAFSQETALRDILGLFSYARDKAILEGVDYGVHVAPAENACWLIRGGDESGTNESRVRSLWGGARHWPDSIRYMGAETSVLFHPDGTAAQAQLAFSDHSRQLAISINPVTGKGKVYELPS